MNGADFFKMIAHREPFSKLNPAVGVFFRDYLSNEKAIEFDGKYVVNTHFPPYPSPAFDRLAEHFKRIGSAEDRRLFSVTVAVTNRCGYRCRHCYNSGRDQRDIPLDDWRRVARTLLDLGVVRVTLSGGEPLLRDDLEDIASLFDGKASVNLNTTGAGMTPERARKLRESGIFAAGVSIDSFDPVKHDAVRGKRGALDTALTALGVVGNAGLYPYCMTVAGHDLLEPDVFMRFMESAGKAGAKEVHLLEPCPVGNLAGDTEAVLSDEERARIVAFQEEISRRDDLPILSSFLYLESAEAFGCGAGLTHLYIDGSGEVSPCNLVPLSFGNVADEPLEAILDRMGRYFEKPRTCCVGQALSRFIPEGAAPAPPGVSEDICRRHLPADHDVPAFFRIRDAAAGSVGRDEIRDAYDHISGSYDDYWVVEAGKPVERLVADLQAGAYERVLEAGCGTGYGTEHLVRKLSGTARYFAVDISGNMLDRARERVGKAGARNVEFIRGDALDVLRREGPFDLVFSSWVLGYIPTGEFIRTAGESLRPGGRLAFIVHRENSPARELGIFAELVAEDPSVLTRQVDFDFPRDGAHVGGMVRSAGLSVEQLREDSVIFRYSTPREALDHLLKSGAGTAFYEAVAPEMRGELTGRFLEVLAERNGGSDRYDVVHDYVACIAVRKA